MRYTSLLFRAAVEASIAAAIVTRRFPSIEVEVDETRLHLYSGDTRPLWGEVLLALREEGIHPVRPRPTWAGRLAALARRLGLEAYAYGDAEVVLVSEDTDAIIDLAAVAARRRLAFRVRGAGGEWEGDLMTRLRLVPGLFCPRCLGDAIHRAALRRYIEEGQ